MRHLVFRLLALDLLAATSVNATWNSQECDPSKPETTPTSRFNTPSAEGTVYDSETQLTWKLCAEGQKYRGGGRCSGESREFKWKDAIATFGDKGDGWRMPKIDELKSLVEKRCKEPAVNLTVFPDLPENTSYFWSASALAYNSDYAWLVYFSYGYDDTYYKTDYYYVRLVRGGQFFDSSWALAEQKEVLAEEQRKKQQELEKLAEAERKKQQYLSILNGPSPRAMYLFAAQMEDQDKEDKAKALYRKIMSAFPDSDFAIKAGDRLTQLRDKRPMLTLP